MTPRKKKRRPLVRHPVDEQDMVTYYDPANPTVTFLEHPAASPADDGPQDDGGTVYLPED